MTHEYHKASFGDRCKLLPISRTTKPHLIFVVKFHCVFTSFGKIIAVVKDNLTKLRLSLEARQCAGTGVGGSLQIYV